MLRHIRRMCAALMRDEDGLTTVEYAVLLAVMVVAAVGTWNVFGAKVAAFVAEAGWCVT